jgi:Amt family ammonium transporter
MRHHRLSSAILPGLASLAAPACLAAETAAPKLDSGQTACVLTASALVLFMTLPGLALFYGGLVRARNLLSVLMHSFAICCVVSLIWAMFGYSLAFDGEAAWLGGMGKAFLTHRRRSGPASGCPRMSSPCSR